MDSQDRLIALDDTMDSETLQHYGVKGMKWGIRRAKKKLYYAANEEQRKVGVDELKRHRSKAEAKIAKLEKKGAKYQSVYEKRITRDAEKSAKLETKSAKKKRKATGVFVTDGRAKELMFEAQKLDAKVSTLDARVKSAKAKVDKNQAMIDAFKRGINDIDKTLIEDGKLWAEYYKLDADYEKRWKKAKTDEERDQVEIDTAPAWREYNRKRKEAYHSELSEDDYIAAEFEINSKYLKQFNTAKTLQEKDWIEHSWENELDELYHYEDDELYHYGVKGMKWGVRNKKPTLKDRVRRAKALGVGGERKFKELREDAEFEENRKKLKLAKFRYEETKSLRDLWEAESYDYFDDNRTYDNSVDLDDPDVIRKHNKDRDAYVEKSTRRINEDIKTMRKEYSDTLKDMVEKNTNKVADGLTLTKDQRKNVEKWVEYYLENGSSHVKDQEYAQIWNEILDKYATSMK